jgi:uncharacterized phage protein gp47/JayE
MPWQTPTLRDVRGIVRDNIRASLPGADASIPNSVLRVLSDAQGGLCHLNLQYIDWLALQLLPDTAEFEWLDRHGQIWLVNSDGTTGRKLATFAQGTATFTGTVGAIVPVGTQLNPAVAGGVSGYETTAEITIAPSPTPAPIRSLDPGSAGNLPAETSLGVATSVPLVDNSASVVQLAGGTDTENDADLRSRILSRIRQPPQGGATHDYVQWALAVPGVTRAWAASEMGMGTITVRFMMDELRADNGGFPTEYDIAIVEAYLDVMRPVAVKDMFVLSPIPRPIDVFIERLEPNTESVQAAVEASVEQMLFANASPGQTIFAAWKYAAIMNAAGVLSFHLTVGSDDVMPSPGHMAVLGDISFF